VRKNRELYDQTSGLVWRLAVYDAFHGGWEFINLGGRALLDTLARRARLGPGKEVLELCSGQGATCRYLAQHYGCGVTGVEMNPQQVRRARESLAAAPPHVARLVRLVEDDVLCWHPQRRYDAVYLIDSLMLIEALPALLGKVHATLRPRGLLMVSVIVAGPVPDEGLCRYAWEMDGMIGLRTPREYADRLEAAGFTAITCDDVTALAVESSATMATALDRHREEIEGAQGADMYRAWKEAGEIYLAAFRQGKLGYLLATARRGA
jgi:cyclopropane fatty-acyl-phospholipid synthase-like methyltransferase